MILALSGRCTSTSGKTLISRQLQTNSPYRPYPVPAPSVAPRLTAEEWKLIVSALSAYQHNQTYRPLYEKLAAQTN